MGFWDYAVLVLYFAAMIVIGGIAMRRIKGQEDYFMGGRGFGKLLQTFAAFGAGTGAHEPVTVGRTTWTSGLSGVWSALMWLFVTPIYWITGVWYRRMRHMTLGDWFVERYESKAMGAAYALFAIVFYMFYLSTMFSAVAKFAAPLVGMETVWGLELKFILIPVIALIVTIYGVLGGLTAAYWTDVIQGVFIILLSVMLIPAGLAALVARFGDRATQNWLDGFTILHERVADDYFSLFAGPKSGEFPVQYIVSLTLLGLVGIVVQPHFIATGGGSAKGELEARIGLVAGNFLKRLCTVGWALTALIALALLAGNAEIMADPDRVWGVAAREILGPFNMGLVGLMLACLLSAMMSSADTYMLTTSALVVRNIYAAYLDPEATEQKYVNVARLTGLVIIVGASIVALTKADVFGQFKTAVELPILFAAPFWVGMYWRRANTVAVWCTMLFSLVFFFILPPLLPALFPDLRSWPRLTAVTDVVTTLHDRPATAADVAQREAWQSAVAAAQAHFAAEPQRLAATLQAIGPAPPPAVVGRPLQVTYRRGGQAIFWTGGVSAPPDAERRVLSDTRDLNQHVVVENYAAGTSLRGLGNLNIDLLIYAGAGLDLSGASSATLETLRLPLRLTMPFVVLMIVSLCTPRNSQQVLDRYYAKMNMAVLSDPAADAAQLELAYSHPAQFDARRLFPGSNWEFTWPTSVDLLGFLGSVGVCGLIVLLLRWIAGIGGGS